MGISESDVAAIARDLSEAIPRQLTLAEKLAEKKKATGDRLTMLVEFEELTARIPEAGRLIELARKLGF